MTMLGEIPAILRLMAVFVVVLFAIRKRVSLGNAFLVGAVIMGVIFGLDLASMITSMIASVVYPKTLSLAVIVSLILVLSGSMESSGHMKRMLERFLGLLKSQRLNMVMFPALIGLLPMPGGAIFSAPMVKELGARTRLEAHHQSYVNYWFRHIWEYWWPLYPGVLLTVTMAGIDLWVFVLFLFPLTVVALLIGYQPIRGYIDPGDSGNAIVRPSPVPFIRQLIPILIVIVLGLGLGLVLTRLIPALTIAQETGLILALCVSIVWVWGVNRMTWGEIRKVVVNRSLLGMIFMVFAILIFQGILEDSHAVEAITSELTRLRIPMVLITVILPFLVGSVVGITIAFVGSTFPILIALLSAYGEMHFLLPYLMLALVSGFVGVLLSPLHLCLLLSNRYFSASLFSVYRLLWLPALTILLAALLYFSVARYLAHVIL